MAAAYYGSDNRRFKELKNSFDFACRSKGWKFQNFVRLLPRLPPFDIVFVCDDDLFVEPRQLNRVFRWLSAQKVRVASPAHDPQGKISWEHMKARPRCGRFGRRTNFVEMTAVFLSSEAVQRFRKGMEPVVEEIYDWGTDFIISSTCYERDLPFLILDEFVVLNPHDRSKKTGLREIDRRVSLGERIKRWNRVKSRFLIHRADQILSE